MRRTVLLLVCAVVTFVGLIYCSHHTVRAQSFPPKDVQWQVRARTTADDPKKARQVILDAAFAREEVTVALAYEQAMREKPSSPERIANFAHAAEVSRRYFKPQQANAVRSLMHDAYNALKPLMERRQEVATQNEQGEYEHFRPTKVSDAWLAWANFANGKSTTGAYQTALTLDPELAEAYYERGERIIFPYDDGYFRTHRQSALLDLSKAEQLQPKLHPLCVWVRSIIASLDGRYGDAATGLRLYLHLWPDAPQPEQIRRTIARFEMMQQKNGTA